MSPRGASMRTLRTRFSRAADTACSPVSTCRYHRRKNTIPNSTKATPPSPATRHASWGVIGRMRSSICLGTRDRAQAARGVGPPPAPARVVGQERQHRAAHERVDRQREQRVQHDRHEDLPQQLGGDRRVHAEQELQQREADLRHRRRGRADGHGGEPVRRIAQLAHAARAVADGGEHQRGHAELLGERDVHEQPQAEAERGAGDRAGEEARRGHQQRREVGGHAEHRGLRDRAELDDPAEQPDQRQAGDRGGGDDHRTAAWRLAWGLVSTWTRSRRRTSAAGVMWMRRSSSPSPVSIFFTVPIGMAGGNGDTRRASVVPAVTIRSPVRTFETSSTRSKIRSPALPSAGVTEPGSRVSEVMPAAAKSLSVISVTTDSPPATSSTRPTSPAALITGSPRLTPSSEPLLTVTRWYQVLGECTNTRASTGAYSSIPPVVSCSLSPACWRASLSCCWAAASRSR